MQRNQTNLITQDRSDRQRYLKTVCSTCIALHIRAIGQRLSFPLRMRQTSSDTPKRVGMSHDEKEEPVFCNSVRLCPVHTLIKEEGLLYATYATVVVAICTNYKRRNRVGKRFWDCVETLPGGKRVLQTFKRKKQSRLSASLKEGTGKSTCITAA